MRAGCRAHMVGPRRGPAGRPRAAAGAERAAVSANSTRGERGAGVRRPAGMDAGRAPQGGKKRLSESASEDRLSGYAPGTRKDRCRRQGWRRDSALGRRGGDRRRRRNRRGRGARTIRATRARRKFRARANFRAFRANLRRGSGQGPFCAIFAPARTSRLHFFAPVGPQFVGQSALVNWAISAHHYILCFRARPFSSQENRQNRVPF